jgi:hypothetical protein
MSAFAPEELAYNSYINDGGTSYGYGNDIYNKEISKYNGTSYGYNGNSIRDGSIQSGMGGENRANLKIMSNARRGLGLGGENRANHFSNRSGSHRSVSGGHRSLGGHRSVSGGHRSLGGHRSASGGHQFGGHRSVSGGNQFGTSNPNFKKNLALMQAYQQPVTTTSSQPITTTSSRAQQIKNQLQYSITNAYQNNCFGPYGGQIYYILANIIDNIPPSVISALEQIPNELAFLQNPLSPYISAPAGALWANLSPNIQSEIIKKINNGCLNGCIPPTMCNKLKNLLAAISGYSGPAQTYSSILNADYKTCMANTSNSSTCNYFLEANTAISDGYNYIQTYM